MYVCALCQGSPSWDPLCVQEKLLAPNGVFQTLQDVLLALVGHTLDSGPTLLSSHVHPLPHYCRREGWKPRENKVPCSGHIANSEVTNSPSPPGSEQSGCCGAGGPNTLIPRPVPDSKAATHLIVLHGGVVRRGLTWAWWGGGGAHSTGAECERTRDK